MTVLLENIENFDWTYCNFDLRPLWRNLGIPAGRFTESSSLFGVSSTYGDIDGDKVEERLLHFRISGGSVSRIVVLKRSSQEQGGWTGLTFLDLNTLLPTTGDAGWQSVILKSLGVQGYSRRMKPGTPLQTVDSARC